MASNDWLGGYTLEELLGSEPVMKDEKKPSKIGKILGAPVRLVVGVVKLPFVAIGRVAGGLGNAAGEVVKLPFRLVGALVRPWQKKP